VSCIYDFQRDAFFDGIGGVGFAYQCSSTRREPAARRAIGEPAAAVDEPPASWRRYPARKGRSPSR